MSIRLDRRRTCRSRRQVDYEIMASAAQAIDFLRNVLQSSTEHAIIGENLCGQIVLWNEGARRLFGYEPSETVDRINSSVLVASEDHWSGNLQRIKDIALREGKWEGTVLCARKNRERFTARVSITPRCDQTGRAIGFLTIAKDVSAETRLGERLKATQHYTRSLIETSLDPLVTISPEGKLTDVNEAWVLATGFEREHLVGSNFLDYFTQADKARDGYQKVFAEGFVRDYPLAIRHASGSLIDVLFNASVYKDDAGNVLGVCASARDITERKRHERSIQEASRLKSEFLSTMSHELRTPLNCIIGFTEFMADEKPGSVNAKQKEYLQDILSSGRHLLQLINDVLDLAKVEAGKMEFHSGAFSLHNAFREVCSVFKQMAQTKHILVKLEFDPQLDEVVLDQQKFKQVLYNLLSNAIKFTNDGGSVNVRASRLHESHFKVAVSDTGIGIRAADIGRLFREFEQLDSDGARRYGGTGLGLALTRKILELQGGTIAVESVMSKGSVFTFTLPLGRKEIVP